MAMLRQDAKSLALFRAIHQKMVDTDPVPFLQTARDWAAHFAQQRPEDVWLSEWVARIDMALTSSASMDALYDLMLSASQHAIDMRSSSPFANVLTTKERTAVLRNFEREWSEGVWGDGRAA